MRLVRVAEYTRFGARRATAWARLRPTYLVIGAQRSGSTSLHDYLAANPAVLTSVVKEVHYFHRYYEKGPYWYRSRFPLVLRRRWVRRRTGTVPPIGEATPDYLFDPRAPARVHAFDSRMRLIAVLRDPVERAFSHWRMEVRHGLEALSFEDALDREEEELDAGLERLSRTEGYVDEAFSRSYTARGRYAEQLERWLELFPEEQLLVLSSEELLADPASTLEHVWTFLGVPAWRSDVPRLRGAQDEASMAPATRERLARAFEPHNRRLEELVGRRFAWTRPRADEAASAAS